MFLVACRDAHIPNRGGNVMNKDQVEGKVKDVAGRVERQVGEWTGDKEAQAHGALKQAEGKVQNAWGDVKDAGQKAIDRNRTAETTDETAEIEQAEIKQEENKQVKDNRRRKAS